MSKRIPVCGNRVELRTTTTITTKCSYERSPDYPDGSKVPSRFLPKCRFESVHL